MEQLLFNAISSEISQMDSPNVNEDNKTEKRKRSKFDQSFIADMISGSSNNNSVYEKMNWRNMRRKNLNQAIVMLIWHFTVFGTEVTQMVAFVLHGKGHFDYSHQKRIQRKGVQWWKRCFRFIENESLPWNHRSLNISASMVQSRITRRCEWGCIYSGNGERECWWEQSVMHQYLCIHSFHSLFSLCILFPILLCSKSMDIFRSIPSMFSSLVMESVYRI